MNEREPLRVQITYTRQKRGTFVINGMDITNRVSGVGVNIVAGKMAEVSFTVVADESDADIEGVEAQP